MYHIAGLGVGWGGRLRLSLLSAGHHQIKCLFELTEELPSMSSLSGEASPGFLDVHGGKGRTEGLVTVGWRW